MRNITIRMSEELLGLPSKAFKVLLAVLNYADFSGSGASLGHETMRTIVRATSIPHNEVRACLKILVQQGHLKCVNSRYRYDTEQFKHTPIRY